MQHSIQNSAVQTINRVIDVFPPHQQAQIRTQLSFVLEGILAQQLIARKSGQGRVLAMELLVPFPAIRNLIREDKVASDIFHDADRTSEVRNADDESVFI